MLQPTPREGQQRPAEEHAVPPPEREPADGDVPVIAVLELPDVPGEPRHDEKPPAAVARTAVPDHQPRPDHQHPGHEHGDQKRPRAAVAMLLADRQPGPVLRHSLGVSCRVLRAGSGDGRLFRTGAVRCATSSAVTRVDDAEAVTFRIRKDDEVWIGRVVPHHASGAEPDQPLDLIGLFVGIVDDEVDV